MLGAFAETVFTIAARFKQVIERLDDVFIVSHAGGGVGAGVAEGPQPLVRTAPRCAAGGPGLRPAQGGALSLCFPARCQSGFGLLERARVLTASLQAQPVGGCI